MRNLSKLTRKLCIVTMFIIALGTVILACSQDDELDHIYFQKEIYTLAKRNIARSGENVPQYSEIEIVMRRKAVGSESDSIFTAIVAFKLTVDKGKPKTELVGYTADPMDCTILDITVREGLIPGHYFYVCTGQNMDGIPYVGELEFIWTI